ncbi:uncharacterized protein SETTUDRAFT_42227 [Exserohilum turcica Et28A]|uniref:Uncharacterized protein n=1 Tax=Exserohilum turcicum (strain 28A) TaxID=671987 RepID=R0IIU8_EXST2|nr:uncharacterized protein SETTUDRAFT_42227 [Exserohilum turcica Et28A]EOA85070.1 hypothetical protein SETTUDRAFT_42227 [Exserohilum turcica Et28A]
MASPPESITTVNGRRCTRSRARTLATSAPPSTSSIATTADVTSSTTVQNTPQIQTSAPEALSKPPQPPSLPPPPSSAPLSPPSSPPPPPPPSSQPPSLPPPLAPPPSAQAPSSSPAQAPASSSSAPPATSSTPPVPAEPALQGSADGLATPTADPLAGTSLTGTLSAVPTSSSARIKPLALASDSPATASLTAPSLTTPSLSTSSLSTSCSATSSLPTPSLPTPSRATPSLKQPAKAQATASAKVPSQAAAVSPVRPTSTTPTSSDTISTATPTQPVATAGPSAGFTGPAASDAAGSVETNTNPAIPLESITSSQTPVPDSPALGEPRPTVSATRGSAGIIAPSQGSPDDDSPLTLGANGNITGVLGGVFGGIAGLALIIGLLFLYLRKRKSRPVRWNEKRQTNSSFLERIRTIPTGLSAFVARLKGTQTGSTSNPYQRHVPKASVDSLYARDANGRARSNSEGQGVLGVQRAGSNNSRPSKDGKRNGLRQKPSNVSSYRFPGIIEDTGSPNPFADPRQTNQLLVLNPDPLSTPATPQKPEATADPEPRDPFASSYDPPEAAPAWEKGHQRGMSSISGHSSQNSWSIYTGDDPFRDSSNVPPMPNQAVLPGHTRRRSSMALPNFNPATTFDANSTFATRDSSFFFGEPGPSRPATNMFTPALPTRRTIRQSDPFDLDRPEVLSFGSVSSGKDFRASFGRQPSRNKRNSSKGFNFWTPAADGTSNNPGPADSMRQPGWVPGRGK